MASTGAACASHSNSEPVTWPLPALAAWAAAWASFIGLRSLGAPAPAALALSSGLGIALAVFGTTRWRRLFIAAGFPLSLAASGLAGALPGWAWLLPLALLLAVYPLNAWRDAPLFPTPAGALRGLAALAPLPAQARVLDAGCGLGAGLRALRAEYPAAKLSGLEWSWPLRFACALRCRFASVRRADIWVADWSGQDLVYLFQRPESIARAVDKAARELRPGAWLASLEFEASGLRPTARLPGAKPVWLYRAPFVRR
jgi:SAM-dependent methyltransferase